MDICICGRACSFTKGNLNTVASITNSANASVLMKYASGTVGPSAVLISILSTDVSQRLGSAASAVGVTPGPPAAG